MKRTAAPEPAVSYHAADEEVQLRTARSDEDEDLPAIYQEASFATVAPAAVPPPPHYSTLSSSQCAIAVKKEIKKKKSL